MAAKLETRPLGKSGIIVPRVALGCATFGREINEAEAFALMDYALEQGITLFDTAEAYGGGQARDYRKQVLQMDDVREVSDEHHSSERIIGRWLQATGNRDQVILVSKVTTNFTRSHVREALEASLERLKTTYLDVYLFHSFDTKTPLEEALTAMNEVQRLESVRCTGCSNFSAQQLRDSLEISLSLGLRRFEVTEAPCSLAARDAELDLLPLCRKEDIAFLGYSPLGAGFLSGKYNGDRRTFPKGSRFDVIPAHADIYFKESNFATVTLLHETASRLGVPALQLAIAWVLTHPEVTTVLCGARNPTHIDNAIAAAQLQLSEEWPAELAPAFNP